MTNWHSPSVILSEYVLYVKFIHFVAGVYIWEILLNLDFDYTIFTRKRKFHASFLLYLSARWIPLIAIIMEMMEQDAPQMNCQAYVSFIFLFTYLGFLLATSLFILRVVAIWEHNRIITAIAMSTWALNLGACIHCVATFRADWVESLRICGVVDLPKTKFSLLSIIATEIVLLTLMLSGLMRWNNRGKGSLWHVLFTQGMVWFVVTAVADIPPLVFIFLNLNDGMDAVTQLPAPYIVSIAATRMYRGLSDYLGRVDHLHSTNVIPADGGQPNSSPFGKFVALVPPVTDTTRSIISGGRMQTGDQVSVRGSLTFASTNTVENLNKAASGGDGAV